MSITIADEDFMDVDDPDVLNGITRYIEETRAYAPKPFRPTAISDEDLDISPSITLIAVLDTNFLISHLAFVASLVAASARDQESPHLLIVVPWTVIQELNGLKSSARRHVPPGSNHSQHAASVGDLAAKANNFLFRVLPESDETDHRTSGKATILRGQQLSETLEAQVENNDDIILDCCRFFNVKTRLPVVLLSSDQNLNVKAMVHRIKVKRFSRELGDYLIAGFSADKSLTSNGNGQPLQPLQPLQASSTSEIVPELDIDMDVDQPVANPTERHPLFASYHPPADSVTLSDHELADMIWITSTEYLSDMVMARMRDAFEDELQYEYVMMKYDKPPWSATQMWFIIGKSWFPSLQEAFGTASEARLGEDVIPSLQGQAEPWEISFKRGDQLMSFSKDRLKKIIKKLEIIGRGLCRNDPRWDQMVDTWRRHLSDLRD